MYDIKHFAWMSVTVSVLFWLKALYLEHNACCFFVVVVVVFLRKTLCLEQSVDISVLFRQKKTQAINSEVTLSLIRSSYRQFTFKGGWRK